jgi:replicative DNA helicase
MTDADALNDFDSLPLAETPSFRRDRVHLEHLVICSSWSDPTEARDLLTFPSEAWLRPAHRAIVEAIRTLLNEGSDVNDIMVQIKLQEQAPQYLPDFHSARATFVAEIGSLGSARKQLLAEFRQEYDIQTAWHVLAEGCKTLRTKSFPEWYDTFQGQVVAMSPSSGVEAEAPTFDQVFLERIRERLSGDAERALLKTGLPALDELLGDIVLGQMILLVGPPGMAKTTFAFQICANLSKADEQSLFVQLEMGAEEMADRAICMAAKKALKDLTPDDIRGAGDHAHLLRNIVMLDRGMSLEECERNVRAWLYKHRSAKAVLTDYAGLLQEHSAKVNPVNAANAVSDYAKRVAKLHGVVHFLLQQPSKQYDMDKKPALGHIRDSGKFRQDADKIIFLHHPYHWDNDMPKDYLQAWILKNRGGRADQIAHLHWRPGQYLIRDWPWEIPTSGGGRKKPDVADALRGLAPPVEMDELDLEVPL